MRKKGATYSEIAKQFQISNARAQQLVAASDRRMERATEHYFEPVADPIAYGVWHEFTAEDGRVSLAVKRRPGRLRPIPPPEREELVCVKSYGSFVFVSREELSSNPDMELLG